MNVQLDLFDFLDNCKKNKLNPEECCTTCEYIRIQGQYYNCDKNPEKRKTYDGHYTSCTEWSWNGAIRVHRDFNKNHMMFTDTSKRALISEKYKHISPMPQIPGYIVTQDKCYLLNEELETISKTYDYIYPAYLHGNLRVLEKGRWGYMNKNGEEWLTPTFLFVTPIDPGGKFRAMNLTKKYEMKYFSESGKCEIKNVPKEIWVHWKG